MIPTFNWVSKITQPGTFYCPATLNNYFNKDKNEVTDEEWKMIQTFDRSSYIPPYKQKSLWTEN
jgi:hypothetical protein